MSNWIDDGHGNKWHKCKLGADCGLKIIEVGKARCWCQDQEASRVEVQAARKEIDNLETRIDQLESENAALLDLIEDLAHQNCHTGVAQRDYNGQVAGFMVTDSGALSVNGQALRLLAQTKPPRFRIVAEFGRMVVGYWPENDPRKEVQP